MIVYVCGNGWVSDGFGMNVDDGGDGNDDDDVEDDDGETRSVMFKPTTLDELDWVGSI